jgi:hypothetical protein
MSVYTKLTAYTSVANFTRVEAIFIVVNFRSLHVKVQPTIIQYMNNTLYESLPVHVFFPCKVFTLIYV